MESPVVQPVPPIDRTLFQTELVAIGAFRCPRHHPRFEDSGPIEQAHLFVFPRTAVTIEHEHGRPFVANANIVTLYNRGQRYLRGAISAEGDRGDWFGVQDELVRGVMARLAPELEDRPEAPFLPARARSDSALYLAQRRVHELVSSGAAVDPLAVEELVVMLLERIVELSLGTPAPAPRPVRIRGRTRSELVHAVERLLSDRLPDTLALADVARGVGSSVHHLCRTFRGETGITMHQYRHQLRLRSSLELVRRTDRSLVRIALELGFSSHSHFTSAFRQGFGQPPSSFRPVRGGSGTG